MDDDLKRGDKPCKPALRDTIAPILNHMTVITDEEESTTVWQVELHPDKSCQVSAPSTNKDRVAHTIRVTR